jgi:hypothetical protein
MRETRSNRRQSIAIGRVLRGVIRNIVDQHEERVPREKCRAHQQKAERLARHCARRGDVGVTSVVG